MRRPRIPPREDQRGRRRPLRVPASSLGQLALLVGAFVLVTSIALAAGAVNLGTAFAFGAMGFALVLVVVMLFG